MQSIEIKPDNSIEPSSSQTEKSLFQYLIVIEPLGFLYGSAGRFLSPDNLVGRSGQSFPPSAVSLAGLLAAAFADREPDKQQLKDKLASLYVTGPFWAHGDSPQNFYVPTPFNYLVKQNEKQISCRLTWSGKQWLTQAQESPSGKFKSGHCLEISDWYKLNSIDGKILPQVKDTPWKFIPHLHPQLREDERRVKIEQLEDGSEQGSLFLENGVQLDPDYCLVYLCTHEVPDGWYRFGGEGHIVDLKCESLEKSTQTLLTTDLGKSFALITPGIWGSNRLSTRYPTAWEDKLETWITERPSPFRYRFGGEGKTKRLSRGRYTVPAGTVYIAKESLPPWQSWDESWFPKEGISLKRWGCGLALPLPSAIDSSPNT
jgi:CRISPR-associated protein Cmr3